MTRSVVHDDPAKRWRTVFVDPAKLQHAAGRDTNHAAPRRLLARTDQQIEPLRANVQDAAAAVVQWVASVVRHDDDQPALDQVLADCLRPGPDVEQVNYEALVRHINHSLHVDLSAQRVQSAVEHLRRHRLSGAESDMTHDLAEQLTSLRHRLSDNHAAL
ncbi:MAG: hypothetical protein IT440_14690, partial [Phycisphaeraceae bacterium]|nr:hypothetical protein [Phycisphaeraceae bacterium]